MAKKTPVEKRSPARAHASYQVDLSGSELGEAIQRLSALADLDLDAYVPKLPRPLLGRAVQLLVDLLDELPNHLVIAGEGNADVAAGAYALDSFACKLDDDAAEWMPAVRALQDLLDREFRLGSHASDDTAAEKPNTTGAQEGGAA